MNKSTDSGSSISYKGRLRARKRSNSSTLINEKKLLQEHRKAKAKTKRKRRSSANSKKGGKKKASKKLKAKKPRKKRTKKSQQAQSPDETLLTTKSVQRRSGSTHQPSESPRTRPVTLSPEHVKSGRSSTISVTPVSCSSSVIVEERLPSTSPLKKSAVKPKPKVRRRRTRKSSNPEVTEILSISSVSGKSGARNSKSRSPNKKTPADKGRVSPRKKLNLKVLLKSKPKQKVKRKYKSKKHFLEIQARLKRCKLKMIAGKRSRSPSPKTLRNKGSGAESAKKEKKKSDSLFVMTLKSSSKADDTEDGKDTPSFKSPKKKTRSPFADKSPATNGKKKGSKEQNLAKRTAANTVNLAELFEKDKKTITVSSVKNIKKKKIPKLKKKIVVLDDEEEPKKEMMIAEDAKKLLKTRSVKSEEVSSDKHASDFLEDSFAEASGEILGKRLPDWGGFGKPHPKTPKSIKKLKAIVEDLNEELGGVDSEVGMDQGQSGDVVRKLTTALGVSVDLHFQGSGKKSKKN